MAKDKKEHIKEVVLIKVQSKRLKKNKFSKSYVIPGRQEACPEDDITWILNDTGAVFYFPEKKLFKKKEYKVEKGGSLTLTVKKNAEPGSYPYAVFTDNDDFAEGGSFPRIIIRR